MNKNIINKLNLIGLGELADSLSSLEMIMDIDKLDINALIRLEEYYQRKLESDACKIIVEDNNDINVIVFKLFISQYIISKRIFVDVERSVLRQLSGECNSICSSNIIFGDLEFRRFRNGRVIYDGDSVEVYRNGKQIDHIFTTSHEVIEVSKHYMNGSAWVSGVREPHTTLKPIYYNIEFKDKNNKYMKSIELINKIVYLWGYKLRNELSNIELDRCCKESSDADMDKCLEIIKFIMSGVNTNYINSIIDNKRTDKLNRFIKAIKKIDNVFKEVKQW